jgi:hypothetical protein
MRDAPPQERVAADLVRVLVGVEDVGQPGVGEEVPRHVGGEDDDRIAVGRDLGQAVLQRLQERVGPEVLRWVVEQQERHTVVRAGEVDLGSHPCCASYNDVEVRTQLH